MLLRKQHASGKNATFTDLEDCPTLSPLERQTIVPPLIRLRMRGASRWSLRVLAGRWDRNGRGNLHARTGAVLELPPGLYWQSVAARGLGRASRNVYGTPTESRRKRRYRCERSDECCRQCRGKRRGGKHGVLDSRVPLSSALRTTLRPISRVAASGLAASSARSISKSASTNALVLQVPAGTPFATAGEPCTTTVRSSFEGIQFGADIARLNVNGWNLPCRGDRRQSLSEQRHHWRRAAGGLPQWTRDCASTVRQLGPSPIHRRLLW